VPNETLHALYETAQIRSDLGQLLSARFVFVVGAAARATLVGCVSPANVVKVEQAPVTVIIGMTRNSTIKFLCCFRTNRKSRRRSRTLPSAGFT